MNINKKFSLIIKTVLEKKRKGEIIENRNGVYKVTYLDDKILC